MSEEKGENLGMCGAHTRGENVGEKESFGGDVKNVGGNSNIDGNEDVSGGEDVGGNVVSVGETVDETERDDKRLQGNQGVQERARRVRGEVSKLAGLLESASDEQLDLLAGADELEDEDALAKAAEVVAAPRRGRGRPKGAANVRNTRVFDYLEALGHRDPLVTLSLIQTADTKILARMMGLDVGEALRIQLSAAKEMLPYKYAKRPQELNVNERKAHIFLTGTLDVGTGETDDGTLSIFGDKLINNQ